VTRASIDIVLLHGAWCGPWIWHETAQMLRSQGLTVCAPQLPIERPAGLEDYVASVLAETGDATIGLAVGHSLAGILLESLAARTRVQRLMYLAAFVPRPGRTLRDQWRRSPALLQAGWGSAVGAGPGDTTRWTDLDAAAEVLFGDCAPEVARGAAARLAPQSWALTRDHFAGTLTTPSTVVVATRDQLLDPATLCRSARVISRRHAETIDAGHMPMISRPDELARMIVRTLRGHTQSGEFCGASRPAA